MLRHSAFLMVQLSHPYMTTGKTIALTRQTFVGKVMSLLFSMLSRLNMSSRFNMLSKGLWRVFSSTTIQKHQFFRTQLSLCSNLKLNIRKTEIMTSSPITSWQMDEVIVEAVTDFIFLGFKITADGDCSHEIKRCLLLGRKTMTNLDRILKSRDISLLTKVCIVKDMVFSSSHIWMWEMDHKEGWAPNNWCFWTVVLKKNLESPMDNKEIRPVNPKGNQPWIFIGRIDAEA